MTDTAREPEALTLGETVMRLVSMGLVATRGQSAGETAAALVAGAKAAGTAAFEHAGAAWQVAYLGADLYTVGLAAQGA